MTRLWPAHDPPMTCSNFIYSLLAYNMTRPWPAHINILQQAYQSIQNPRHPKHQNIKTPFAGKCFTTFCPSIFASRKLVPFLAAQETFKAQAEAKYLADELEAKLAPAEAIYLVVWWKSFQILQRKHGEQKKGRVCLYLGISCCISCAMQFPEDNRLSSLTSAFLDVYFHVLFSLN